MALTCLESVWQERLTREGWQPGDVTQFMFAWSPTTLNSYNRSLQALSAFCDKRGTPFPPTQPAILANFLSHLAARSERPRSTINTAVAAVSNLFQALGTSQTSSAELRIFASKSLVKAQTTKPMVKSKVLPIAPFRELFLTWPDDSELTVRQLRLKCITLLALALMLRPSDIAPHARIFDNETGFSKPVIFSTDNITFCEDGSALVTLTGIKNDTTRDGFQVCLRPTTPDKLNPVSVLHHYIVRTDHCRPPDTRPVFLPLRPPYKHLSADTIAQVLNEALKLVHLNDYSAKDFRPTGATVAIDNNVDPESAMMIGRWKTRSVFFDHYVHSKPVDTYTTDLLYHD